MADAKPPREISRRAVLGGLTAAATLAGSGRAASQRAEPERRPNVLLIVVDDMRFDEYGAGGHPYLATPNIDRIAREGVRFRSMFHATPLCSPNRASILTGEYSSRHGIYSNVSRAQLSHRLRTVTGHLRNAGYQTAHVGKWHMGDDPRPRPGYDYWVSFPAQGKILNPELWEDGGLHTVEGYVTDILTARAARFLETRDRSRPFFLYLGHKAIHPDAVQRNDGSVDTGAGMAYMAAPRHAGCYAQAMFRRAPSALGAIHARPKSRMVEHFLRLQAEPAVQREFASIIDPGTSEDTIRARAEMMLAVDEGLGVLLETLARSGDLDETVVIFTSDNGFFFGEHGLSIERRLPYEEVIRMPVLLRYPRLATAGGSAAELGSSIDIAPTIVDLAGRPVPPHMQGRSLKSALGGARDGSNRAGVLIEHYSHDLPMPWMLDADYKCIRTRRHKYIHWTQYPELAELYDLDADPYETVNLCEREPALAAAMRRQLGDLVNQSLGLG